MSIGRKLKEYLSDARVEYDLVEHPRTECSSRTAQVAHIPGDRLAKGVVLHHDDGYVLAVVPSTHRVEVGSIERTFGCTLDLASEPEIADLFDDCRLGAVPATGAAYEVATVVDDSLAEQPEIWFEGGDHRTLVHVSGDGFRRLMAEAQQAHISHHV
ncbi:MAG: YbaK/EbsC family protein [Rhodospirillales bacterium]|nr:MAG: YbaK/EbsC family protein [Rhodospirillales bacterium]